MSFKIGDKVICVEGYSWFPDSIVNGEIYTILDVGAYDDGDPWVRVNIPGTRWLTKRFRKLDDDFGAKIAERIEKTFIKPLIPVEYERA